MKRGVALVDEGEYDSAILILDTAARRLAATPGHSAELSQAYLYLGIAYLGKGQEAAARARFREAVGQIKSLTLSPEKFAPKVINAFEAAKEEAGQTKTTATATAPAKKRGSHKGLLIGLGVAAAGGGVALAVGGGGGSSNPSSTTPGDSRQTLTFSGTVSYQDFFTAVASKTGTLEARVQWQNGQISVEVGCQEKNPPYTDCGGTYNRTTNTTGVYTASVTQKEYLISVSNYSGTPEPYTLTILFP